MKKIAQNFGQIFKIQWQKPMLQVIYALVPIALAAVYFYGWRALIMLFIVSLVGFLSEWLFTRRDKKPVTSAVFVTSFLFALSLPPRLPYWMAAVGIIVAVVFGKMAFGGFGRNTFNPALVGRAFIYVAFAVFMTDQWFLPVAEVSGGFLHYSVDTVAAATPLAGTSQAAGFPLANLLFGNRAGSLGETSAILLVLSGLYLLIKKTASYRIVLGGTIGFLTLQTLFWWGGVNQGLDPLRALLSGSFLYGIMFMATDPVSASQTTDLGRWIYGGLIGVLISLIRTFSVWPEGVMFAILLVNTFAPLLDTLLKPLKQKAKEKIKAKPAPVPEETV